MAYWIALPEGDGYKIYPGEQFEVKSNARSFADRMGWDEALIVTEKQKEIIEGGGVLEEETKPEPPKFKKGKK